MVDQLISDLAAAGAATETMLFEGEDIGAGTPGVAGKITTAQIRTAALRFDLLTANEAPSIFDDAVPYYRNAAGPRIALGRSMPGFNPRRHYVYFHDFPAAGGGSLGEGLGSTAVGTGAAVATAVGSEAGAFGIARCETGTTATGYANIGLLGILAVGGARIRWRTRARIAAVSDATDTYTLRHGFGNASGGEWSDGIGFRYTHGTNSGNWQCYCRSGGVETVINTSVAPTVGSSGNWQVLEIEINAAGTSVQFFVGGTSQGSITATIPTAGLGLRIGQINKSVGAVNRTTDVDYVQIIGEFTADR